MKRFLMILPILFLSTLMLAQESAPDSSKQSAAEKALEAELAKSLGADSTATAATAQPSGTVVQNRRILNPQISVIGSFLGSGAEKGAVVKQYDSGLSEAEFSFRAYVDPYSRADFYVGFGRESEDPFAGPDSAIAESGEFGAELEEAYFTTLALPFGLQLKGGKFRSSFGRINLFHPHALNFLDMPRMYVNYFGEEGLNDRGLSLSWLIPNPLNFYQELTVEATSGAVEGPSFAGGGNHLLYLAHLKNFFDLNQNTSLEIGLSGISGVNDPSGSKTRIGGVDLTLKWKPLRASRYRSFEWMSEALFSERDSGPETINSWALYSFMRYQLSKRWFAGLRYDYSQFPENDEIAEKAYSAILNFQATEFQKVELQFQHGDPAEQDSFNRVLLRIVFVIGAHGAHQY